MNTSPWAVDESEIEVQDQVPEPVEADSVLTKLGLTQMKLVFHSEEEYQDTLTSIVGNVGDDPIKGFSVEFDTDVPPDYYRIFLNGSDVFVEYPIEAMLSRIQEIEKLRARLNKSL